jgi:hypothetical protein
MVIMQGILQGSTGGGAGVTPPTLPAGLILLETESILTVSIQNNDPVNPCVVEMAFDTSALQALAWDDGTAASPSFAVDPGGTRNVTLERGSGSPTYGDPDVHEAVTSTLADGSTVEITITVEGKISFKDAVAGISVPTFEYLMDADNGVPGPTPPRQMFNTGTALQPAPGFAAYDVDMENCQTTADPNGFEGYVEMGWTDDRCRSYTAGYPLKTEVLRTQDRSYVFVWDNETNIPSNAYLTLCTAGSGNNGWGWLYTNAAGQMKSQYVWGGGVTNLSAANGTNDNIAGVPEDLYSTAMPDTSPRRCLLVVAYDHATGEVTMRWKVEGNGVGHTYITAAQYAVDSTAGAAAVHWMGWSSGSATTVRWRYLAVVDTVIGSADFEALATLAIG